MTLNELVKRLRIPPEKGAHEVVRGPDGMNHLVIITDVHDLGAAEGTIREFGFMSWCGATNSSRADELEVVKDITCIQCIQWKAS